MAEKAMTHALCQDDAAMPWTSLVNREGRFVFMGAVFDRFE